MLEQKFHGCTTLLQVEDIFLFEAEPAILGGRGSVRIVIRVGGRICKSYAFRRHENAACVLPASEVAVQGLRPGDQLEFEVGVQRSEAAVTAPADLLEALNEARVCLDVLHPRDRHQLVQMVRESSEREIRSARISAAVAACKTALTHQQRSQNTGGS